MFPFVILLSGIWFFLKIKKTDEIIAIKISGVSNFSVIILPSVISILLGIFFVTSVNPVTSFMVKKYESIKIPNDIDYRKIKGLSNEILSKLELIKPMNLLHASRIEGVTPAAMTLVNLHIKRKRLLKREKNLLKNNYDKKSA